ncbi:hypothetical protein V2O64_16645 [Verrucomicrobiaceae bacterium 227]
MQSDYQLDDLIRQNADWVVYRVLAKDGTPSALTRLRLEAEDLDRLTASGAFEPALKELIALKHDHLRPVTDGGVDKVDRYPWIVGSWFDGKPLSARTITLRDIKNIGTQLHSVVADLGKLADVLCFDADEILTIRTPDDFLHILFTIDYHCWFRDRARGLPPGTGRDASVEARNLLEGLVASQPKQVPTKTPIPFVEARSPALSEYKPPRDHHLGKVLVVLGLLSCLGTIIWFTLVGQEKANQVETLELKLKEQADGN